ncbi:MAG: bL21 family ribosomal protein, partial [bacterium]|nr:bL21 family ribosomal protein [bacterium]
MLAIIETGGKQYRVSPKRKLHIEKILGEPGSEVVFDKVLLAGERE